jgi:hypothetical protein
MTPSEASGFFSLAGATTELQVCILTGVSTGKVFHPVHLEIDTVIYEPGYLESRLLRNPCTLAEQRYRSHDYSQSFPLGWAVSQTLAVWTCMSFLAISG